MSAFAVSETKKAADASLLDDLSGLRIVDKHFPAEEKKLADGDVIAVDANKIQNKLLNALGEVSGIDSEGNLFSSVEELWRLEFFKKVTEQHNEWYDKGFQYWENETNCPISDNGVLGGFGHLTPIDTIGSNLFLDEVIKFRVDLKLNKVAGSLLQF
jgi:hypothetical protein